MIPLFFALAAAPLTPDGGVPAPSAREMAQVFFLAGDLRRAVDQARRCMQVEGRKKCEPLYRALVEYEALAPKTDKLTKKQAKAFIEWDRFIAPQAHGKLSQPVLDRFVDQPLEGARRALQAGDDKAAKDLASQVLEVDPNNVAAKRLLEAL